jgi:hypothetical protein
MSSIRDLPAWSSHRRAAATIGSGIRQHSATVCPTAEFAIGPPRRYSVAEFARIPLRPRRTILTIALLVLLSGCGSNSTPKYIVKGRITYKGEPIEVKPMVGRLRVLFLQEEVPPPVDPKHASVKRDGTFEVRGGADNAGIVAGKYKICVIWQDDFPRGPDKLDNQFDKENSRIYRRVPEDGEIVIDVGRPEG